MSNYKITKYSYDKAKQLGVQIYPSHNPKKKIDVYKSKTFICSIGATGYKDYPMYIIERGKVYADNRRRLYKLRHTSNGLCEYYANEILW